MVRAIGEGPHPVDRHVGRRVCEKRIALGYNQSDLGVAIGVTFQQVQKYEKGANRISASKLWDIAAFFKTDVAHFFQGLEGVGAGGSGEPEVEFAVSRSSVEIGNLAPRLSVREQKVMLDILRSFADRSSLAER